MIRRRCGESIHVGENIEIQVLEVAGGRVTLGISAPLDVLVLRNELKLTAEFNRQASRPASTSHLDCLAATLSRSKTQTRER